MSRRTILAIVLGALLGAVGCSSTYKGGNIHDGTTFQIGVKPVSDSSYSFSIASYLNGWVFSWESNDAVKLNRTSEITTSFMGIYSNVTKTVTEVDLSPVHSTDYGHEQM